MNNAGKADKILSGFFLLSQVFLYAELFYSILHFIFAELIVHEEVISALKKQKCSLQMWLDATTKEIMKKLKITDNQVKYYIKKLKDDGKIERVGTNRKGSWKIIIP